MAASLSRNCTLAIGETATTAVAWRFKGEVRVTVVAKATFAFANDTGMPRIQAQPIFPGEIHHAGNPLRSIVAAGDRVPFRKRADVYFTGHACAAGGSAESVAVRLGVAAGGQVLLDRRLVARKKGGVSRIPILWERTILGPDNPQGEDEGADALNLFDPSDPKKPAGLGPLSRNTPSRKRRLGGLPLPDLGLAPFQIPDTFDFDYFQVAPADQQIPYLRGDEWILLEGLHPQHSVLRMHLPGARAQARIYGLAEHGIPDGRPLAMIADGLHASGDDERCTVVWRGSFPVASEEALSAVRVVAGVELPGAPLAWPDPAEVARAAPPLEDAGPAPAAAPVDQTLALGDDDILVDSISPLPFSKDVEQTLPISAEPVAPASLPFRPTSMSAAAVIAAAGENNVAPLAGSSGDTLPAVSSGAADPFPFAAFMAIKPALSEPAKSEPAKSEPVPQDEPVRRVQTRDDIAAALFAAPAPAPREEPAPPPPPKKKLPPKVDVGNKLYGTRKKS